MTSPMSIGRATNRPRRVVAVMLNIPLRVKRRTTSRFSENPLGNRGQRGKSNIGAGSITNRSRRTFRRNIINCIKTTTRMHGSAHSRRGQGNKRCRVSCHILVNQTALASIRALRTPSISSKPLGLLRGPTIRPTALLSILRGVPVRTASIRSFGAVCLSSLIVNDLSASEKRLIQLKRRIVNNKGRVVE